MFPNKTKHFLLASKDNPPSIPQTSEDILEMESKFSKTPQDKIVNEQEEILKQIKAQTLANQKNLEGNRSDNRGTVTTIDKQPMKKNGNSSKSNHVSHTDIEVYKHTQGTIAPYKLFPFYLKTCESCFFTLNSNSILTSFRFKKPYRKPKASVNAEYFFED